MALYGGIELPGCPSLENIRKLDLLPMRAVMEMERRGMAIDIPYLNQLTEELAAEMVELRYEICSHIPAELLDEFVARANISESDEGYGLPMNVNSGDQIARLLFDVLRVGEGKQLRMTKGGQRASTGKKQMEQLKRGNPVIQRVLDYRERAKLRDAFTEKLPKMAREHPEGKCWCGDVHDAPTMRVHTQFKATRTRTRRYASSSPNLQQIPARKKIGKRVRRAFQATPSMKLISVDFSQMEMRDAADYSGDVNLCRIFDNDLDPHVDTARRAFGLAHDQEPDKMTQRDPSKTTNFQTLYGGTPPSIFDTLVTNFGEAGLEVPDWLTLEWTEQFQRQWFDELYPGVKEYIEVQKYRMRRYGMVWTRFGGIIRTPEVRSVHKRIVEAGFRQGGNAPIQGTCADINKLAIAKVYGRVVEPLRQEGVKCWMGLTIHDELIVEAEEKWAEFVKGCVVACFEGIMEDEQTQERRFKVPIKATGTVEDRWVK